ncbi:MAG: DUF2061 domain-containing protein [Crocinitomicaceae bacterium]
MRSTVKRHIAKTITWRVVGTLDTILLGWLLTGDISTGVSIGAVEFATKMFLYFIHERIWFKVRVFREASSNVRHILKTITWRFVGTMDTMFLGWLISGSAEIGLSIGGLELFTKMILYYLHERIWYKSLFGLKKKHA